MSLKVGLETDAGSDNFDPVWRGQGDRQYHLGFSPTGPEGSLALESAVRDWVATIPVPGQVGSRKLRVRLLDDAGKELDKQETVVVLDITPPDGVRFVSFAGAAESKTVEAGQDDIQLTGKPGDSFRVTVEGRDKESGIKKVLFYWGTPDKEPPADKMIEAKADGNGRWVAPLTVDKKGPADLTVKFVNGVELSKPRTISVDLREPVVIVPPPPPKTGTVVVKVMDGDSLQHKVPAALQSTAKDAKDPLTKDPDEDGRITFEDVAPGTYKVSAAKKDNQTSGEKTVTVEAGKTVKVEIELRRK
jgi:hypothetical protein